MKPMPDKEVPELPRVNCGTPPDRIWVHPWRELLYYSPTDQPGYIEYVRADTRALSTPISQPAEPRCVKCGHSVENLDQEGMCHTAVWPKGNAPRTAGYPCGCHCEFSFSPERVQPFKTT